jgi:hypothetical protein
MSKHTILSVQIANNPPPKKKSIFFVQASRRSVNVVAAASPGSWFPGNPEANAQHLSGADLPGKLQVASLGIGALTYLI